MDAGLGAIVLYFLEAMGWSLEAFVEEMQMIDSAQQVSDFLKNYSKVNPEANQTKLGELFRNYGYETDGTYEGNTKAAEAFYDKTGQDAYKLWKESQEMQTAYTLIGSLENTAVYITSDYAKDMRLVSMLTYGADPSYLLLGGTREGYDIEADNQAELEHEIASALISAGYLGKNSTVHLLTETYNLIAQNSLKVSLWMIKVGKEWGCKLYLTPTDIEDVEMTKFAQQYFTAINELRITNLKDIDGNSIVDYYTVADRTDASSSAQASVRMLNMGDVASLSFGTQYHITNGYTAAGTYIAIVPNSGNRDITNIDFDQVVNDGYVRPTVEIIDVSDIPKRPIDSPIIIIDNRKDPDNITFIINNNIIENPTPPPGVDPITYIYNNTNLIQYIYNTEETTQYVLGSDGGGGGGGIPIPDAVLNPIKIPDFPSIGGTPSGGATPSTDEPATVEAPKGFFTIYEVTPAQMGEFRNWMWGGLLQDPSFEGLQKIFANPIDAIISSRVYPRELIQAAEGGSHLRLGNVTSTAVGHVVSNPVQRVFMGSIKVLPKFHSYLDYDPYTTVLVLLPFVGLVPLDTDMVMNAKIDLYYTFDLATGASVAQIYCTKGGMNQVLIEQYPCQFFREFPITGMNYQSFAQTVASGITNIASETVATLSSPKKALGNGLGGIAGSAISTLGGAITEGLAVKSQRTGTLTGEAGVLGTRYPILIIERPIENVPNGLYQLQGQPCNQYRKVSDFIGGFVKFQSCDVSNVKGATKEELDRIREILTSGFYI